MNSDDAAPAHPVPGDTDQAPNPGMGARYRIVALIPAFNNENTIADTVKSLIHTAVFQSVVVIDDASADQTANLAELAGARVVRHFRNRGKGAAIRSGFEADREADVYLLVDADTGATAAEAIRLLLPVVHDEADLVIGSLPPAAGAGGFGLVKTLSKLGIKYACGFDCVAPLSGQRSITNELLTQLKLAERFGVEVAMTIDAIRAGARVIETDVEMTHAHRGKTTDGFKHRARQGRDIASALAPRLPLGWLRPTLSIGAALILIVVMFFASSHNAAAPGKALPRVDGKVRIVLLTGEMWNDDRLANAESTNSALGGLVTGPNVKDVVRVAQSGSRDTKVAPHPDVEVIVGTPKPSRRETQETPEVEIQAGVTVYKGAPALRPLRIIGHGIKGEVTSASTKRDGIVDLTDLAPTVLAMTGKPIPSTMSGQPVRIQQDSTSIKHLASLDEMIRSYDKIRPHVILFYILAQVGLYIYAYALARINQKKPSIVWLGIIIASFPFATYLTRALLGDQLVTSSAWFLTTTFGCIALTSLARIRSSGPRQVLARIFAVTITFMLIDLCTGGRFQMSGIFGSSPLLAARYFGLGNPASVVLLIATILWSALHVSLSAPSCRRGATIEAASLYALVTVAIGLPGLGADVGGMVAAAITGCVMFAKLLAGRFGPKAIAAVVAVPALALAGLGALDYSRPIVNETHLGRSVHSVNNEGLGPLLDMVERKVEANVLSYGFPYSMVVLLLACGFLVGIAQQRWKFTLPSASPARIGATMAVVGGLVSYLLNDSGIVVVALIAIFLGPFLIVEDIAATTQSRSKLEVSTK